MPSADPRRDRVARLLELTAEHPAVAGLLELLREDERVALDEAIRIGQSPEDRSWWSGYAKHNGELLEDLERWFKEKQ